MNIKTAMDGKKFGNLECEFVFFFYRKVDMRRHCKDFRWQLKLLDTKRISHTILHSPITDCRIFRWPPSILVRTKKFI